MEKKTKIMIVGAGTYQVPLIQRAIERGMYTIVVSPDGPYPGLKLADKVCCCDVRDEETVLNEAVREKIDGVITDQTDIAVRTVAYVAEKMGLPGIGYETAKLFTDKIMMRDRCRQLGIPTIDYRCVSEYSEALEFYESLNADAIIKPADNQGSRGVFRIDSKEKLEQCFEETIGYSGSGRVVIERFIEGTEFEADSIVVGGEEKILMYADLAAYSIPDVFASTTRLYPSEADPAVVDHLLKTNHAVITGFGLEQGLTHSEYIMDSEGTIYLIEAAARGGGTYISSHIAKLQTGVDTNDFLLDIALGLRQQLPEFETGRCACGYVTFYIPEGTVIKVEGVDEIRKMDSVCKDSFDDIYVGLKTENFADKTSRYAVILSAENRDALMKQIAVVRDKLKIEVETSDGIKGPVWG